MRSNEAAEREREFLSVYKVGSVSKSSVLVKVSLGHSHEGLLEAEKTQIYRLRRSLLEVENRKSPLWV